MATIRRLGRLVTSTLRQGVRIERRNATLNAVNSRIVVTRVQLRAKSAMALSTFRLIRHLRGIRRPLVNNLSRIASIRANGRSFLTTLDYHLLTLDRRQFGT